MRNAVVALLVLVGVTGCGPGRNCTPDELTILDGLIDDQSIVSYVGKCSATVDDDVNVSFYDSDADYSRRTGNILHVYHAYHVRLQKIAPDSVRVLYAGRGDSRVFREVSPARGIHFEFKNDWSEFE